VKRESLLVIGLMLLAAARVAIYAALLPALTRPDELQHYDRVLSVAKGETWEGVKPLHPDAIGAFFWALREQAPAEKRQAPPSAPTTPSNTKTTPSNTKESEQSEPELNHEFCEPPLYYVIAGRWHALGEALVWRPSLMPYWDRFLNIPLVAGLVGLGYLVGRRIFTGDGRLIVPIWLALLPQSDQYGINNDVLMPIAFGLFVLIYALLCANPQSAVLSFLCGLTLAGCAWTKTTSVPLLVVGVLAFAQTLMTGRSLGRKLVGFASGLLLTVPLYVWNLHIFGHLSGAWTKMQMQGYSIRPFAQWFRHPIFTPGGLIAFWTELTNAYWLGEMPLNHWQGQVLLHAPYVLVWLCPLLTLIILAAVWRRNAGNERRVLVLCWTCFVASAGFLAVSSAPMNFGIRPTPTAWWSFPGFVGGRLMIGTLLPFAVLTASACERFRSRAMRLAILLSVLITLNAVSAWLLADAFSGRYSVSSVIK
jgi:hypothetical protein